MKHIIVQIGNYRITVIELNEILGHKHNIQPLAVSGRQGLLLRDDVQISTSLSTRNINNDSISNISNDINLNAEANIESTTSNLPTNTTSEIQALLNASNVENNYFNETSHNRHTKQVVQTSRTARASETQKTIERLLNDILSERKERNEIQRQLLMECKLMRNAYEERMKNIEEQLIRANQLREERNKYIKEYSLENKC